MQQENQSESTGSENEVGAGEGTAADTATQGSGVPGDGDEAGEDDAGGAAEESDGSSE